jgi:hypothetical protein
MPNVRTKVVYTMDSGEDIAVSVPTKYVALGGFTAYTNQAVIPRPNGLRLRKATLRTHVADSAANANDAHFLERKVPCQGDALAVGGTLAPGTANITHLDYASDAAVWVVQGWVGERKKNIQ